MAELKINTISINPVNIQKNSLVEYLFYQKRYRPPWFYSLFKCLLKAFKNNDILNSVRIISSPSGAGTKRGIHNCLKRGCNEFMIKALKEFVLTQNINALINKAVTLQGLDKVNQAIRLYDKALKINPNNIDALINKGSALHTLEKYLEAIMCYDLAIKIDKKCAMALAYKGLSLGEIGNLNDAIKHFKKALSIDQDYDLANISKKLAQDLLKDSRKKSKTV